MGGKIDYKEHKKLGEVMELFYITMVVTTWLNAFIKTHRTVYYKG